MTMSRQRWLLPVLTLAALGARAYFVLACGGDWTALESGPVLCPFRLITGLPCPGCGMTRAGVALAMGEGLRAAAYHPLALPAALAAGASGLLAWLPAGWGRSWRQRLAAVQSPAALTALAVVMASWLARLPSR